MRPNRFVTFFTGSVEILVRGPQLEKLINLIIGAGLALWDVRRLGAEVFQAKMRAPAFLAIRPLIRRSGAVVKIRRKQGWPFLRRRLGARKAFWIGAAIFVAFLFYLSSIILVIKVEGFKGKEREDLLESLNRAGLRSGLPRNNLWKMKELIEQEVLLRTPKAAWLEISLRGVVAEVKVVPRKMAPAVRRRGDLVAAREGVVSRIITIRGTPLVKEGDTVAMGDVLISGTEWRNDPASGELTREETAASGIVEARVWYDWEVLEPKAVWQADGEKLAYTVYQIRIGGRLRPIIAFGKRTGRNYHWIRWRKRIYRGRNPLENVEVIKDTWYQVAWRRIQRPASLIRQAALQEVDAKRRSLGCLNPAALKAPLTLQWSEDGDFIKLAATMEVIQPIADFAER